MNDGLFFFDFGGIITVAGWRDGAVVAHHVPAEPDLVLVAVAAPRVEAGEKKRIREVRIGSKRRIRTCGEAPVDNTMRQDHVSAITTIFYTLTAILSQISRKLA